MIFRILVATACFLTAAPAFAECAKPEQVALIRGEHAFVQTRMLKGVKRPLAAEGVLKTEADTAVWTVKQPIEIVTRIGPEGVTQAVDGGPPEPVGPQGTGNPFFQDTGLVDLLRGDLSRVEEHYEVKRSVRTEPAGWTLALSPKSELLSKYIASVTVEGCQRVASITVVQSSGDTLRIDLKDPS